MSVVTFSHNTWPQGLTSPVEGVLTTLRANFNARERPSTALARPQAAEDLASGLSARVEAVEIADKTVRQAKTAARKRPMSTRAPSFGFRKRCTEMQLKPGSNA